MKKSTKAAVKHKLRQSWSHDHPHRATFTSCPHCEEQVEQSIWDKCAHTLVLNPQYYRVDSVEVVAECPKCHESSWLHYTSSHLTYIDCFPEEWKVAVKKQQAALHLLALRTWGAGICWKCKHLEKATLSTHAYRYCKRGSGGPVMVAAACDIFETIDVIKLVARATEGS